MTRRLMKIIRFGVLLSDDKGQAFSVKHAHLVQKQTNSAGQGNEKDNEYDHRQYGFVVHQEVIWMELLHDGQ